MRPPSIPRPEEPQSMSAMTDVVFLLLIFFIVTMAAYVETTLLEANLPASASSLAAAADVDLQKTVKVELSAAGEYRVNGTPRSREAMDRLLSRYARLMPDAEFLIACDPESRHHELVTLLAGFAGHRLKNLKLLKSD